MHLMLWIMKEMEENKRYIFASIRKIFTMIYTITDNIRIIVRSFLE